MKVTGKLSDIQRREVDGETVATCWIEQQDGRRVPVETKRGEHLISGEIVEAEGKTNSEGVLVADRISNVAKPKPPAALPVPVPEVAKVAEAPVALPPPPRPIESVPPAPPPKPIELKMEASNVLPEAKKWGGRVAKGLVVFFVLKAIVIVAGLAALALVLYLVLSH